MTLHPMRRCLLLLGALLLTTTAAVAQGSAQQKKSTTAEKPSATLAQIGPKETSCDGALEIVPAQAMTFTRKRRPVRTAPAAPETKSEKNQPGESKN